MDHGFWGAGAVGGGRDRLLGSRKSLSLPDQFSLVLQGTRFREVLGKDEECSTGPLGRGRGGLTASQGFHCVFSAPAAPTVAQSLGSSHENKKRGRGRLRRRTHWLGQSLGEGAEGAHTPSHKGKAGRWGCPVLGSLLDLSSIQFNKGGGWSW